MGWRAAGRFGRPGRKGRAQVNCVGRCANAPASALLLGVGGPNGVSNAATIMKGRELCDGFWNMEIRRGFLALMQRQMGAWHERRREPDRVLEGMVEGGKDERVVEGESRPGGVQPHASCTLCLGRT